jgi:hypothetical protein
VKLADDDRVYHARDNFRRKFEQTVDSLRDKTVLSFNKEDIQQIRINSANEEFLLTRTTFPNEVNPDENVAADKPQAEKEETLWQSADGQIADKMEINGLLNTLSNLRCKKYLDDNKKENLSNPIFSLTLKGVEEYSLFIYEKKDKEAQDYPAVSSANDYPFLIEQWQADKVIKISDRLFKEKKEQEDAKDRKNSGK